MPVPFVQSDLRIDEIQMIADMHGGTRNILTGVCNVEAAECWIRAIEKCGYKVVKADE